MSGLTSNFFNNLFILLMIVHDVLCQQGEKASSNSEPNWIFILLVFILTSAIAVVTGIALLCHKPRIADPPLFKVIYPGGQPVATTYKQYPLEYDGMGSEDMYPMTTRNIKANYEYGDQIVTQEL